MHHRGTLILIFKGRSLITCFKSSNVSLKFNLNSLLIIANFGRSSGQSQGEDAREVKKREQFRKWEVSPVSRKDHDLLKTLPNVNEQESSGPGQLSVNSLVPSNVAQRAQQRGRK